MTKKGFEFCSALKKTFARTANKCFYSNITPFHTFLASSNNSAEIEERTKSLTTIADQTELKVVAWLELVKLTPEEETVTDLILTVQEDTEDCCRAAFCKIKAIDRDEITSFRSARHRSSSRRFSKETLINVKAEHVALEQNIKFSNGIDEQQKVLSKLTLQQELSKTIAEETIHEDALQMDEHLFDSDNIKLPKETPEQLIDHFMNNMEVCPTHQIVINNLLLL